jgi:coatomer protein complex subunit alpha (xenin)
VLFHYGAVVEAQKDAAKLMTQGKFSDALAAYQTLLQSLVMAVATTPEEERSLQELVITCQQYVLAVQLEVLRKDLTSDADISRNLELIAYFTCCKLSGQHTLLTLRVAMSAAYKASNFITAAYFAKRILGGTVKAPADLQQVARKVLAACEAKATDAHVLDFDMKEAGQEGKITLCSGALKPIPPSAPTVTCPYCQAVYTPEYTGKLCGVCKLAKVGARTLGIQFRNY